MEKETRQTEAWSSKFGKEYTDRNSMTLSQLNASYVAKYGVSRKEINERFVGALDRNLRILEVGSNVGLQLECLQSMGFHELYGIELQWYAVEQAKARTHNVNLLQGSAFDLPFKDGFFDLVFTSGVLIHVAPDDLQHVMGEIYRCARRYVWGFEYFSNETVAIEYRGASGLLWKADYAAIYRRLFPDLRLAKELRFPYLEGGNEDAMFLLEKR